MKQIVRCQNHSLFNLRSYLCLDPSCKTAVSSRMRKTHTDRNGCVHQGKLQGKKVTALLTHIDWEPQDWTDSPGASDYKGLQ
eukprot:scaffold201843_cov18-Tisochrysis_lutea.AAC.2